MGDLSVAARCRGCPHPPHLGFCTRRNGQTAYPCVCSQQTAPEPSFADGVEFFGDNAQCARCGSTAVRLENDSIDLGLERWWACLSGADWCGANPMPGRENVTGAGRAPRVGIGEGT